MNTMETKIIKELKKRAKNYWDYYDDTDDTQSQGIALGLEEAIQVIINEQNDN